MYSVYRPTQHTITTYTHNEQRTYEIQNNIPHYNLLLKVTHLPLNIQHLSPSETIFHLFLLDQVLLSCQAGLRTAGYGQVSESLALGYRQWGEI
jgi:hypothetical protein